MDLGIEPPRARPADLASEIVNGLGDGFLSLDADWRISDCNTAAERLLRQRRADLLGHKLWSLAGFAKDSPFAELGRRVAERRRPEEAELAFRRHQRARILSVRIFPLAGGLAAVWRDITAARTAERRLAHSEARYREIAHGMPAATWLTNAYGRMQFINPAMADALGRPAEELLGEGWIETVDPDDRAGLLLARSQARSTHSPFFYQGRFRRSDGALRIVQLYGRPRFNDRGGFRGYVGMGEDVTEVRAAEARQRVLVNELNHRVKNVLATVQSIVRQTLREHAVDPAVEAALTERILALASAHDVLTRRSWKGAELGELSRAVIRPHDHHLGRVMVQGPEARIAPNVALALAMALHELMTNAVKHGALATSAGQVRLSWTLSGPAADMEWRESGGTAIAPPTRLGFGSRLLGRVLAHELGQPAELSFAPTGLVCRIHAPVEEA